MSYLKGKDIKIRGDCLVYYHIKKIEYIIDNLHPDGPPVGFSKW